LVGTPRSKILQATSLTCRHNVWRQRLVSVVAISANRRHEAEVGVIGYEGALLLQRAWAQAGTIASKTG
jgi:hypothetical protein